MPIKHRLPLLLAATICLELFIWIWAILTTDADFVFDKCARNSARASSGINLAILLMIGYFGLSQIYQESEKRDWLRILVTLFTVNHLMHFLYVFINFKHHTLNLQISDNKHGFVTFLCIGIFPIILWSCQYLSKLLYGAIILHLFNVSYFIMDTFNSKIKPDKPAYHNQFGIYITSIAMIFVLHSIYREYKNTDTSNS